MRSLVLKKKKIIPILKLRKLRQMKTGELLRVELDDEAKHCDFM